MLINLQMVHKYVEKRVKTQIGDRQSVLFQYFLAIFVQVFHIYQQKLSIFKAPLVFYDIGMKDYNQLYICHL